MYGNARVAAATNAARHFDSCTLSQFEAETHYSASELAVILGISRDGIRQLRRRGHIVGIQAGHGAVFPGFQFDLDVGRVRPVVDQANRIMTADHTEYEVLAWWWSDNGRHALAQITTRTKKELNP